MKRTSCLWLLLCFAAFAHAHEVRPAYLEIIEQQDGSYSLTWKQPSLAEARIDGHKGRALTFDPRTGELSQPLYVVSGRHGTTTVLGEIEP